VIDQFLIEPTPKQGVPDQPLLFPHFFLLWSTVMRNFMSIVSFPLLVVLVTAFAPSAAADLVIFDTTPRNNQANLGAAAGQTFTTPDAATLGVNTLLKSVEQFGPSAINNVNENVTYGLQLWTDVDQNPTTWTLGTLLGTTSVQTIGVDESAVFDFTSFNIALNPSTVYAIRFVDANGDAVGVRIGLTGTNSGLGAAQGSLFSAGAIPFSNNFDSTMIITTTAIPEPGSWVALIVLTGTLGIKRRRQRQPS